MDLAELIINMEMFKPDSATFEKAVVEKKNHLDRAMMSQIFSEIDTSLENVDDFIGMYARVFMAHQFYLEHRANTMRKLQAALTDEYNSADMMELIFAGRQCLAPLIDAIKAHATEERFKSRPVTSAVFFIQEVLNAFKKAPASHNKEIKDAYALMYRLSKALIADTFIGDHVRPYLIYPKCIESSIQSGVIKNINFEDIEVTKKFSSGMLTSIFMRKQLLVVNTKIKELSSKS